LLNHKCLILGLKRKELLGKIIRYVAAWEERGGKVRELYKAGKRLLSFEKR